MDYAKFQQEIRSAHVQNRSEVYRSKNKLQLPLSLNTEKKKRGNEKKKKQSKYFSLKEKREMVYFSNNKIKIKRLYILNVVVNLDKPVPISMFLISI